jgi:SAM-dependent methyltransferase
MAVAGTSGEQAPGDGTPAAGGPAGWQERARSFGQVAGDYSALRPGYPDDAVAYAVGGVEGHSARRRVLDLAAGTGLLTEKLAAAGHDVLAVEPADGMRAKLVERLRSVAASAGTAEAIPLPDGDVDVVTAAQAAHWFDPGPAAGELLRVLRPGGAVSFVWNMRDERMAWSRELDALLARQDVERFTPSEVTQAFVPLLDARLETFESLVVQRMTPDDLVAGIATRSYVATMAEPRRGQFLGSVRELLATHPETRDLDVVDVRLVTSVWRLLPRSLAA